MSSRISRGALLHFRQTVDVLPERVAVAGRPQHGAADVFPDRHFGEDVGDLERARQPAPVDLERPQAGDDVAVQPDLAGGRLDVTADQVEGRRLAGAVRADDRMALALRDAQIEVADDADICRNCFCDGVDRSMAGGSCEIPPVAGDRRRRGPRPRRRAARSGGRQKAADDENGRGQPCRRRRRIEGHAEQVDDVACRPRWPCSARPSRW